MLHNYDGLLFEEWRQRPGAALRKLVGFFILDPAALMLVYRLSQKLYYARYCRPLAYVPKAFVMALWGADIHPAASIGRRLDLAHPTGVVIGARAQIGDDVRIWSSVTVGMRHEDDESGPRIGDGCHLSTGSRVLGPVSLGANVVVGANAVVLDDVEDGSVVVGVPARAIPAPGRP